MLESQPADMEQVRYAFRLGWVIAELRGRYRPDRFGKREPGNQSSFLRKDFELPLANERSQAEIRIELFDAAEDFSRELKLVPRDEDGHPLLEPIKTLLERMDEKDVDQADLRHIWTGSFRSTGAATPKGDPSSKKLDYQSGLAFHFFKWDAQNQDDLVLGATQAAAYQLGRGLAETYWALHPDRSPNEMGSWQAVLGLARRDMLLRLSSRLSAYIGPLVLAAIDGSLRAWSALATATDTHRRDEPDILVDLFQQGLLWRDLIRGERQPEDLLTNKDLNPPATTEVWKELKLYKVAAESLKWPLITGAIGAILLAGGAALLASGTSNTGLTTAISVLGGLGLTSASMYAKAKTQVTSLFSNLSQKVKQERIRQAANLCPLAIMSSADAQRTAPGQSMDQQSPTDARRARRALRRPPGKPSSRTT